MANSQSFSLPNRSLDTIQSPVVSGCKNVASTGTETDPMISTYANPIVPPMTARGLPHTQNNHPFHRGLNLHLGDTIDFVVGAHGNCQNDLTAQHG